MKQHLFILLLFTGFVPLVLLVPCKYYLIQQGKSWSDAQTYCRADYTDLAIITSNEDMIQLQNEAHNQLFSSSAWIGLYNDLNSWRWSMGNELLGSFSAWVSGQPNNRYGMQTCVAMYSMRWVDETCTDLLPSICFDNRYTDNQRYIPISSTKTWSDAQVYCRQHHTDLASLRDATEVSIINGLSPELTWFGLFRDTWKWTDQTNFSTLSWMPGQPDNALMNEDCGYLDNGGQVADAQCSDLMPFFCYAVITGQQQIVGVKVQSSEDVNDPAVNAAILEQIKQKLRDRGMAGNITVKWRKQPDGAVFHKMKQNNTNVENKRCDL